MKMKLSTTIAAIAIALFAGTGTSRAEDLRYTVIKVTNTADSGTGSLRDCVQKSIPRVCIFETSGRIKLKSALIVDRPNLYIAGQTAPSPGIMLTNYTLRVKAADVTIEHLSVRVGDSAEGDPGNERDGVSVWTGGENVTLRNLSISWAVDENFSTYGRVRNVKLEDSIVSEALYKSIHPKGAHSMGALIGETARGISLSGNLFAANNDRNVRWKFDTVGEMLNNIIYGWGGTSSWNTNNISDMEETGKSTLLDVIGNVFLPGPMGYQSAFAVYSQATSGSTKVYMKDNLAPRLTNLSTKYLTTTRYGGTSQPKQTAAETAATVFAKAGSRPWDRNEVDKRVIAGVQAKTLTLRDHAQDWPSMAQNVRRISIRKSLLTKVEIEGAVQLFEKASSSTTF